MVERAIPSKVITVVIRITKDEHNTAVQCNRYISVIYNLYAKSDRRIGWRRIFNNVSNLNDVSNVHLAVTINITIGIRRITCDNFGDFLYVGIVNNTIAIHITFNGLCISTHTKQH